jgi:NADH-quinone oxidoreductase subunit J
MVESVIFYILALATVGTALLVILQRNPVVSAIYLIMTFFSLAGIYLLLQAEFIAMIQVLVYAGAIMVLFLFVIMLLNLEKEKRFLTPRRMPLILGILLGGVLLFQMGVIFRSSVWEGPKGEFSPEKVAALGNTEVVARLLFTDFLLPFEITSILLLVAIIGAIVLAKRELK